MPNDSPASTNKARFVPGVYNHCDHWCDRCRFQTRCRLHRDVQRQTAQATGDHAAQGEQDEDEEEEDDKLDAAAPPHSGWDIPNFEPTPSELEEARLEEDRITSILNQDPLVIGACEYSEIVMGLAAGLDPLFEPRGDAVSLAALDAIHRLGILVGVKTRRATRGWLGQRDFDDFARDDANLTAKLVRLVIRESREAWAVLTHPDHAIADGVPMRMIARLDAIDEGLAARFPQAMDSIRAGFDE